AQIPPHDHTLPGGGVTGTTGGGLPFSNEQPSLTLQPLIATAGIFPSQGGGAGSAAFIGQIATFAGNFAPHGWEPADGQLLPITSNPALFSILGTTYGSNGITTFALPDLKGRTAIGTEAPQQLLFPLGDEFAAAAVPANERNESTPPRHR